jgi:REP element-mobilizing transposase RayT
MIQSNYCPVGTKQFTEKYVFCKKAMSNSYTQIHLHCIFAVKYRDAIIRSTWRERLHQYITGIVQNHDHKMLVVNSMSDHVHMLIGMRPKQSLSDLMKMVKQDSSEWINNNRLTPGRFRWQLGFGAFSYAKSDIGTVAAYIENQEMHHKRITFLEEYKKILEEFAVAYDDAYIFQPLADR